MLVVGKNKHLFFSIAGECARARTCVCVCENVDMFVCVCVCASALFAHISTGGTEPHRTARRSNARAPTCRCESFVIEVYV